MTDKELLEQFSRLTPAQLRTAQYLLTKKEHRCSDTSTQLCCDTLWCKSCYVTHVRNAHGAEAIKFLEKLSESGMMFHERRVDEPRVVGPKNIAATSQGRIKCCDKFRSPGRHWSHTRKYHSGVEHAQAQAQKKRSRNSVDSFEAFIANLSREEAIAFLKELIK